MNVIIRALCLGTVFLIGALHAQHTEGTSIRGTSLDGEWRFERLPWLIGYFYTIDTDSKGNVFLPGLTVRSSPVGTINTLVLVSNASGEWKSEKVYTDTFGIPRYCRIAIDKNNRVHLAWHLERGRSDEELYYATNKSGFWKIKQLTDDTLKQKHPDIAVDSDGNAHISYHGEGLGYWGFVSYTTNRSGTWVTERVPGCGSERARPYDFSSIAVDSKGNAHIVYQTDDPDEIGYATNATGKWQARYLTYGSGRVDHPIIAIDGKDNVHVVYSEIAKYGDVFYKNNTTGYWTAEMVSCRDKYRVWNPYIDVDREGNAYVTYFEAIDDDLSHDSNDVYFATNVSGTWVRTNLTDNDVDDGICCNSDAIAVDRSGYAHIIFRGLEPDSAGNVYCYHATNAPEGIEERDLPVPVSELRLRVSPSPFCRNVQIEFELPFAANVILGIYDISGRLVQTLVKGEMGAGSHVITWDGTPDRRKRLSSGVYFCILESEEKRITRKIIVAR